MPRMHAKELTVYPVATRHFVFAPKGRGEELRSHLESYGIRSAVIAIRGIPSDRLELRGDVDVKVVQSILDHWGSGPQDG